MNKFVINHLNRSEEFNQYNGLVKYIHSKNLRLFYSTDNIYNLLDLDANGIAQNYLNSSKITQRDMKIKFLADSFLHEPIKTVFTMYDNPPLTLSKGFKKIIACALTRITDHHILTVSKDATGTNIESDDQLYELLRLLNPDASTFQIDFNLISEIPNIHFCEDINTICNYFHQDETIERLDDLKSNKVLLVNNAQSYNKGLDFDWIKCPNANLDLLAEQFPQYDTIVVSDKPNELTPEYISFVQSNFYKKKKIKIGIGKEVLIYNKHEDGISSAIIDPPKPAGNGSILKELV